MCAVPAGSAEARAARSQGQVSGPRVVALLVKVVKFEPHVQEHPPLPENFLSCNFGRTPWSYTNRSILDPPLVRV